METRKSHTSYNVPVVGERGISTYIKANVEWTTTILDDGEQKLDMRVVSLEWPDGGHS